MSAEEIKARLETIAEEKVRATGEVILEEDDFRWLIPQLREALERQASLEKERDEYVSEAEHFQNKTIDFDQANGILKQELEKLRADLQIAVDALEQLTLGHEHREDLPHIRALGTTYGWCDHCATKVTYGPGIAEEALEKIKGE